MTATAPPPVHAGNARSVLVLDGDAAAAVTVVQSLGRAGFEVTLAGPGESLDRPAFRSRFVARQASYPDPLRDKTAFQAWARAHGDHDLVIPVSERTLIPLHEIRGDAAFRGTLALPPPRATELAFDKEKVRALAAEIGLPVPETVLVRELADLERVPVAAWLGEGAIVLKSVRSKAWGGDVGRELTVRMVLDEGALYDETRRLLESGPVQLQPWLAGHGVGIELLVDRGETVLSFAHERLHELPLTGGGSCYRRSIAPPPALLEGARRLVRALDWHGVAMVEYRHDPARDRAAFIELNGRFWGSLSLATFAGVDFPLALARLLLDGERPAAPRTRAVYARKLASDVEWTKRVLRLGIEERLGRGPTPEERRLLLLRPLAGSLAEWARAATGREVWDGAAFDDPAPILAEVSRVARDHARALARRARRVILGRRARDDWHRPLPTVERVLVLCSGNICRSAYAGARLAEALRNRDVEVRSAALSGPAGRSSPPTFQRAARARNVDLADHRSQPVTDEEIARADLILIMDSTHALALKGRRLNGKLGHKVRWLGAVLEGDPEIADPVDFDAAATNVVLERIDAAVERVARALARS
jgi:protein-tyrosine-phosphatase/predicted ATP-grasp superfamily ATP-dependent carboligase